MSVSAAFGDEVWFCLFLFGDFLLFLEDSITPRWLLLLLPRRLLLSPLPLLDDGRDEDVTDVDESIVIETEQRSLAAIHKSYSVETSVNCLFYVNFKGVYDDQKNKNVKL